MKRIRKRQKKDHKELILRVVQLKHDLGAAGLYKTMHAMEYAVTAVGWEVAVYLQGKAGYVDVKK